MKEISIKEEDFLKAANLPITTSDDQQKKRKQRLQEELDKVWEKYTPRPTLQLEEELHLTRTPFTAKTDDELQSAATKQLSETHAAEQDVYRKGVEKLRREIDRNRQVAGVVASEKKAAASKQYDEDSTAAQNAAVKKGMSRSSVVSEQKKNLADAADARIRAAEREYGEAIGEALAQTRSLDEQAAADKELMDNEHRRQIAELVTELREEDKRTEAAVNKANNDAAAKEMTYNKKIQEKNAAAQAEYDKRLAEYESKDAQYVDDIDYYSEAAKTVIDFYTHVDPAQALEEFVADDDMKKRLGKYYNLVYSRLLGRILPEKE